MRAISVIQPYATFIALGVKRLETRTWSTQYRGPIAIHASSKMPKELKEMCGEEPFLSLLRLCDVADVGELPLGEVVGVGELLTCAQVNEHGSIGTYDWMRTEGRERDLGNFAPGRWAWAIDDVWIVERGHKVRGELGLWDWKRPQHRTNWGRRPWRVQCARPGCTSQTLVGVRARCWPGGVCSECATGRLPGMGETIMAAGGPAAARALLAPMLAERNRERN